MWEDVQARKRSLLPASCEHLYCCIFFLYSRSPRITSGRYGFSSHNLRLVFPVSILVKTIWFPQVSVWLSVPVLLLPLWVVAASFEFEENMQYQNKEVSEMNKRLLRLPKLEVLFQIHYNLWGRKSTKTRLQAQLWEMKLLNEPSRFPGVGNGNPLQYSCLKNSMDRNLVGYCPWGWKELDTTDHVCHSLPTKFK